MFVTKNKYEKLNTEYKKLLYNKTFDREISSLKVDNLILKKQNEELKKEMRVLKADNLFKKQLCMWRNRLIKDLKGELENSFDYDELMILLHEEYTALQCSQIIDNFSHNMRE